MVPVRSGETILGTDSSEALPVGSGTQSEDEVVDANDRPSAFGTSEGAQSPFLFRAFFLAGGAGLVQVEAP